MIMRRAQASFIFKTFMLKVKDVLSVDLLNDVDITTDLNEITVSWRNVFTDSSKIYYYEVALGSVSEGILAT